jgi:hypothetical protein
VVAESARVAAAAETQTLIWLSLVK